MTPARPRNRADRLELLARVLGDRPGTTAADLAREFGLSPRTVFRDLETLRERGYPIDAARGRGGGLRLHANWGLGRVLLARDEALCMLLALAVAEKLGFPMFAAEIGRARRRVVDAFPAIERKRIAPLRERIFIGAAASPAVQRSYRTPATVPMRRLQVAFVEERVVLATYRKEDGSSSERLLEPHALLIDWPAWYVIAHDRMRDEPRTFRLDRFGAIESGEERFRPRPRDLVERAVGAQGIVLDRV